MKTKILVAAIAAAFVAVPAQAKVSFSGQVSSVANLGGDFDESFTITQNGASGTRFRFKADKKWGGITTALRLEIQDSKDTSGGNNDEDLRYADISFAGAFGKISFGQGDGAANGVSEAYSNATGNYFAGVDGVDFAFGSLGGANGYNNLDFLSRNQRLRYDSPKFGGVQVSGSVRSIDGGELALRYAGDFSGWKVTAQAGASYTDSRDLAGIALGLQMPFGLTLGYRTVSADEGPQETNTAAIGYRIGKFRTSIEGGTYTDADGVETDISTVGFTYAGPVTLFASYGTVETPGAEDFSAPIIGARMTF
ncbi:MAG: porin [Arenicella sp.]